MKLIEKYYEDENFIAKKTSTNVIIKDKKNRKYYEIPIEEFDDDKIIWKSFTKTINIYKLLLYWGIFAVLLAINIFFTIQIKKINVVDMPLFALTLFVYMVIFIFFHEAGHLLALKHFNYNPDKIGFKLNYIFPSFYVRMNDTYLLNKLEKLVIHSAGLFASLLMNATIYMVGYATKNTIFKYLGAYMVFDILMNTVPILNSDGYKVVITLLGINERKSIKSDSKVLVLFKVINYIIVVLYTIWFIKTLL